MAACGATCVVSRCYKREANGGAEEALAPSLPPEEGQWEYGGVP